LDWGGVWIFISGLWIFCFFLLNAVGVVLTVIKIYGNSLNAIKYDKRTRAITTSIENKSSSASKSHNTRLTSLDKHASYSTSPYITSAYSTTPYSIQQPKQRNQNNNKKSPPTSHTQQAPHLPYITPKKLLHSYKPSPSPSP